jgi:hypothetical protein
MPHIDDGMRIEPAMSEPMPNGEPPAAISAASPPDEPPEVRAVSHGLAVRPCTGL